MKNIYYKLTLVLALLLPLQYSWAQGTTTAAMNGRVTDNTGSPLPGATVVAVHTPTNTQYGVTTNTEGRYNIQNMRVGGPYTVKVSFVGFQDQNLNNINLALGQNLGLDFKISESSTTLGEVEVSGRRDNIINSDRTGAATNVSRQQIESLPTISRSLADFTRLTPQATTTAAGGLGVSFAGQNNRYNNFSIDGTVNNDVFGLAQNGTNGGQTGVQPISLDAIQAIQVVLAPFDVRQSGFTGGGVNAITRSGSNDFEGSAYYFGNNEKLVGRSIDASRARLADYTDYQTGFRLGGPIIKDKLFFFVNGEVTAKTQPLAFEPGAEGSNFTVAELTRVAAVARRLGYEPGTFGAQSEDINSEKLFGRLDWNITNNHQLTVRHSYVYGEKINLSRSPNTARFYNNAEFFPSTNNTTIAELKSSFGNSFANDLLVGYTTTRDDRDPLGSPFPYVNLRISGGRQIQLGGEPFSVANQLDQNVLTITNNFNYFLGKHTFTIGTHNEFYKMFNLFIRQNYGAYEYTSIEDFEKVGTATEVKPSTYNRSYSLTDDPEAGARFTARQLGFYVQDEYSVLNNLKVTAGVRLDLPTFNDKPGANAAFNEAFKERGLATNKTPGTQYMFSPRVGVNWDVLDNGNTQVRGGAGLFTGRAPFVWIANQYTNTGLLLGSVNFTRAADVPATLRFNPDPFNQPTSGSLGRSERTSEINITDPNFKFPQIFRTNLGIDQKLPSGIIATLEGIYSKTLNNIFYQNLNFEQKATVTGPDDRPIFRNGVNSNFNDIIYLTNTNKGYSYSLTGQLQKAFESGLYANIAYTYGVSKDVTPGNSSQARSNWINVNQVYGLNDVRLAFSDNDIRSRVVGSVAYQLKYENESATTISLFYNGQSGIPLSYIYNGDVNDDAGRTNDLIYIPNHSGEILFSGTIAQQAAQWTQFNAFIEGNDYLRGRRGQFAERNGDRLPWQNQFDLRLMHDIKLNITDEKNHRIQISFDIFNAGNLINKDWGRQYGASFNAFQVLDFKGYQTGTTIPTFEYTGRGLTNGNPYFEQDFLSRWRGQVGLRYIFD